jgi:hypothetical protein
MAQSNTQRATRRSGDGKPDGKPNILVIWGGDIGIWNLSCYSSGMMGYRTPNIDRLAAEGMRFTDSYGEQSCTAGRAAFITGQSVFRTGLSKVGLPGAAIGLRAEDPTRKTRTILKTHGSRIISAPVEYCTAGQPTRTIQLKRSAGDASAGNASRIPAR